MGTVEILPRGSTWIHVNDVDEVTLRNMFPDEDIMVDGDCGSVWGEKHPSWDPCPHHHVLIRNPCPEVTLFLRTFSIGYVYTGADWADAREVWNWREDPECISRVEVGDFRTPVPDKAYTVEGK